MTIFVSSAEKLSKNACDLLGHELGYVVLEAAWAQPILPFFIGICSSAVVGWSWGPSILSPKMRHQGMLKAIITPVTLLSIALDSLNRSCIRHRPFLVVGKVVFANDRGPPLCNLRLHQFLVRACCRRRLDIVICNHHSLTRLLLWWRNFGLNLVHLEVLKWLKSWAKFVKLITNQYEIENSKMKVTN